MVSEKINNLVQEMKLLISMSMRFTFKSCNFQEFKVEDLSMDVNGRLFVSTIIIQAFSELSEVVDVSSSNNTI